MNKVYLIQFKDNTDKIKYVTVNADDVTSAKAICCNSLKITVDNVLLCSELYNK